MKILMSIHDEFDRNSGGPGATANLADALQRRGHDVQIISLSQLRGHNQVKRRLFPIFVAAFAARHPEFNVLDCSLGDAWVIARFWQGRPALVTRSHGLDHIAHAQLRIEAEAGHVRYPRWYDAYKTYWRLPEVARSITGADLALMLNKGEARYVVERFGMAPERVVLTRNAIIPVLVDNARRLMQQPSPTGPRNRIAFIGSLIPVKGIEYLRAAMLRVLTEQAGTTLTYFGIKERAAEVLPSYPESLRDRISVVPYYSNAALPVLLKEYSVSVLPSLFEGFVIAPLEAMSCGLVPVCFNISGPDGYIRDGENGYLVPPRDSDQLAQAILSLIDHEDTWRTLRANALATAATYTWDDVARETEEYYGRAIEARVSRKSVRPSVQPI